MTMDFLYTPISTNFLSIMLLTSLGIWLRVTGIITEPKQKFLTNILLNISLPCFIIKSFMIDIDHSSFNVGVSLFIWGIIINIAGCILSSLIYFPNKSLNESEKICAQALVSFGSYSFFGLATVMSIYDHYGVFTANIIGIPTRFFIYTYGMISISGLIFRGKDLLNILLSPIIIASLIGIIIFFTQDISPQIIINNQQTSIFRIDHSLPFLYKTIKELGSMLNPIVWIITGTTLTKKTLSNAIQSLDIIFCSLYRIIIVPSSLIILYIIINKLFHFRIENEYLAPALLLAVSPPPSTMITLAIKYDRAVPFCSSMIMISTLLGLIIFPIAALIINILIKYHYIN